MNHIFSPDSKIFRVMNRMADLVILNLIYFLTCLPVVTIGAATAAMYTICFRMDTDRETNLIKPYLEAFRDNWKQATGLWIGLLLFGAAAVFDSMLFYNAAGILHFGFWVFAPAAVFDFMLIAVAFPLVSQFRMPWKVILKNSVLLALGRFPTALGLGLLQALPLVLFFLNPALFLKIGFLWVLIYFSASAYLGSKLLKKAFAPLYSLSCSGSDSN